METSNIIYLQRIEDARRRARRAGLRQPWRTHQTTRAAPRFQPSFRTLLDYLPAEAEAAEAEA